LRILGFQGKDILELDASGEIRRGRLTRKDKEARKQGGRRTDYRPLMVDGRADGLAGWLAGWLALMAVPGSIRVSARCAGRKLEGEPQHSLQT
jgi:hypothetical protein